MKNYLTWYLQLYYTGQLHLSEKQKQKNRAKLKQFTKQIFIMSKIKKSF